MHCFTIFVKEWPARTTGLLMLLNKMLELLKRILTGVLARTYSFTKIVKQWHSFTIFVKQLPFS